MSVFIGKCPYCFYITDIKCNLNRHILCRHKDIIENEKNVVLNEKNVVPNEKNVVPNEKNVVPNEKNVVPDEINVCISCSMMCSKCNKIYKTKKSLIEHEKKCKGIDDLTCPKCMMSFADRHSKSKHMKRNNCKARSIIHARTPNEQNIQNAQTINNTTNIDNTTNNTTNNIDNSITNNTTNNIININNYGDERTDYITKDELYKILLSGHNTIPRYIEYKHFNNDFPENHNIIYTNENKCKVMEDNIWKEKDIASMSKKLIRDNTNTLLFYCKENEIELKNNIQDEEIFDHVRNKMIIVYHKTDNEKYNDVFINIKDLIKNWKID